MHQALRDENKAHPKSTRTSTEQNIPSTSRSLPHVACIGHTAVTAPAKTEERQPELTLHAATPSGAILLESVPLGQLPVLDSSRGPYERQLELKLLKQVSPCF